MTLDTERLLASAQANLKPAVGMLAGVHGAAVLRYDLPLERAGQASTRPHEDEADHTPGNLRVRILELDGLPARPRCRGSL